MKVTIIIYDNNSVVKMNEEKHLFIFFLSKETAETISSVERHCSLFSTGFYHAKSPLSYTAENHKLKHLSINISCFEISSTQTLHIRVAVGDCYPGAAV